MDLPNVTLQPDDKVMPLDLSFERLPITDEAAATATSSISHEDDNDDDKDDEIIVTLSIPGRSADVVPPNPSCMIDPIVIPSDSEDSDSDDVTILSDVPALRTIDTKTVGTFGQVLGVSIAGPSDTTDADCFVSSIQYLPKCSITRSNRCLPGGAHAGLKRIYEDSSSQSSVGSLDSSAIDSLLVPGNDPFLSDASSNDGIGFIHPSAKSTFNQLTHTVDLRHSLKTELGHSANSSAPDHVMLSANDVKADLLTSNVTNNLAFGITQLLSSAPAPTDSTCFSVSAATSLDKLFTNDSDTLSPADSSSHVQTSHHLVDNTTDRPPADSPKAWTVHSKGDCKVLLRRSTSCNVSKNDTKNCSSSLTPSSKRRRLSVEVSLGDSVAPTPDLSHSTVDAVSNLVAVETSLCYGCRTSIAVSQLSYCMAGHGCCGQCLQSQVKTLLASGKKGTLKCRYSACSSFYLVSQLHNSLPSMVVEILEEKLDREYCDNAAKLMLKAVGKDLLGALSDDDFDEMSSDARCKLSTTPRTQSSILDPPKDWEPMTPNEEYRLVELIRGSTEYNIVSSSFHLTMTRPRAVITKIQRVQNQILWQFYMVKKQQMERDGNRPVVEKNLFHGTCASVTDAICRYNFDWRLCGAHGTMYGQGSYFARDAAYSHMYTDQPPSHSSQQQPASAPSAVFNQPPAHSTSTTPQMLFQAFPGSSHAVSIAALHSCRFAHLQGALLNPMSSSSSAAAPFAMNLSSYWLGTGVVPSSSQPSTGPPANASDTVTARCNVHTMFLARVLVGDYTAGKSTYRKPPPVDSNQPFGRCYDSCVNDPCNPTIYVIFNNAQCYPEYIIEYTNKPRGNLM